LAAERELDAAPAQAVPRGRALLHEPHRSDCGEVVAEWRQLKVLTAEVEMQGWELVQV